MPAVIREDQIPAAIESLRGYMAACEPISMDPVGFTAEEIAAIQKMRIDKAKVALENIGIQVSQALASLQALASPTPRDIADSADAAIAAHQYIPDIP